MPKFGMSWTLMPVLEYPTKKDNGNPTKDCPIFQVFNDNRKKNLAQNFAQLSHFV
jgi:hypothetical protein